MDSKSPRVLWLYVVGVLSVGTYAAIFAPVLAGRPLDPITGFSSMVWTGLFFYLWWRRRASNAWQGALIGALVGLLVFGGAAFLQGYLGTV